jgi:hypothetical protein
VVITNLFFTLKEYFMKKTIPILFIILFTFSCLNFDPKSILFNQEEFLGNETNNLQIYDKPAQSIVFSPFSAKAHNFYRGVWMNIEDDPYYVMLELVVLNNQEGAYLVAYYSNFEADFYCTPGAQFDTDATVFNTVHFFEKDFQYSYEVGSRGIAVSYSFTDKYNRKISFLMEEDKDFTKELGMLATIGRIKEEPTFFPSYMMAGLGLVPVEGTTISITVDNQARKIKMFPMPVENKKYYFIRYSVEPIFLKWMPDTETLLNPLKANEKGVFYDSDLKYEIERNNDYLEIKKATFWLLNRSQDMIFSPSVPEFVSLREGIEIQGRFVIQANQIKGLLGGTYTVAKRNNKIYFKLNFCKAWQPPTINSQDLWVKYYQWEAVIDYKPDGRASLSSHWTRIR